MARLAYCCDDNDGIPWLSRQEKRIEAAARRRRRRADITAHLDWVGLACCLLTLCSI